MFDVVLLADAEDIIRIVFIILVVGFSVISKFIGSFVETKNPPTGAPRRPPSNRPPSPRPASQPSASGQGSAEAAAGTQSGRSQSARTPPDRTDRARRARPGASVRGG